MDMKKVVEDRLYNLEKDEASLQRMEEEIQSLIYERSSIRSAQTDGNPTRGGGNGRSAWLDNNIQQCTYLKSRIEATRVKVNSLRSGLDMLTKEQQKVLDVFFIHKVSRPEEYLADTLHMDKSTAWRKRKQALADLCHALYGGAEL